MISDNLVPYFPEDFNTNYNKKPMATRGASARRKGHQFERDIAAEFRDMGWHDARRHLEYQSIEAELGQDLDGTYPFLIQCKARQKYVSLNRIEEVKDKKGEYPLLIAKADHQDVLAVMKWEDLKELILTMKIEKIL